VNPLHKNKKNDAMHLAHAPPPHLCEASNAQHLQPPSSSHAPHVSIAHALSSRSSCPQASPLS